MASICDAEGTECAAVMVSIAELWHGMWRGAVLLHRHGDYCSAVINKLNTLTPTGKRPLGRPRHTWQDNTKMDFKEIGINTRNWVDSAQDRIIGEPL